MHDEQRQDEARSPTPRSQAKAERRAAILAASARLFASAGFNGVSIDDLGAATGVSGPEIGRAHV